MKTIAVKSVKGGAGKNTLTVLFTKVLIEAGYQLGKLKSVLSRTGTKDTSTVSLIVKDIPLGNIHIKENIRSNYDDTELEELLASIRSNGLLQPIIVYAVEDGYVIKTGHRRFMAYEKLYEEDQERFHRIPCIITDAENIEFIQLVENVQRVDLSQIDLCNAYNALRKKGMTIKEISKVVGKSEGYIKNLFMGINEIAQNPALRDILISHPGMTIKAIRETKGIPDMQERLALLNKRAKREITYSEMIMRGKAIKKGNPIIGLPDAVQDCPTTPLEVSTSGIIESPPADLTSLAINVPPASVDTAQTCNVTDSQFSVVYDSKETPELNRIQVSIEMHPEISGVIIRHKGEVQDYFSIENKRILSILEKDLRLYFGQQGRYRLVDCLNKERK